MRHHVPAVVSASALHGHVLPDFELRGRIRAAYVEMPGLNLTLGQAARLFAAEPTRCARALDTLVRDGYLAFRGRCYIRAR